MERLLQVLGAEPLDWSYQDRLLRRRLGGGPAGYHRHPGAAPLRAGPPAGADCFVVSCQMCQANLDLPQKRISKKFGQDYYLPVLYFTELIGLALGHPDVKKWLAGHLVDPLPLLEEERS